ncbi:hypothetical protein M1349_02885 [Patescibacteria group bacterium]|nr:hypothetical protein [Patescibacteria group bacterium]
MILETKSTPDQSPSTAVFFDHKHPGLIAANILRKAGFKIETHWPASLNEEVKVLSVDQETSSLYQGILETPEINAIWACQKGETDGEIGTMLSKCDWSHFTRSRMEALFHVRAASIHMKRWDTEHDEEHLQRAETSLDSAEVVFPEGATLPEKPEVKKLVLRAIKSTMEKAGMSYYARMKPYFEKELVTA